MRIQYLQTSFEPLIDPPELGGGRYQEIINNYQIKEDEIWDSGCGKIIHIWPAICEGRMKKLDASADSVAFFMNTAIENEIRYILYS
jgi:hypothetical protein